MAGNSGFKQIVYPVKDVAKAKAMYRKLLDVEPYVDGAYYVGFRIGEQEIGLDPNAQKQGINGPIAFFQVNDIRQYLKILTDAGATVLQDVRDVGKGMLIASVKDMDGNIIGLKQIP